MFDTLDISASALQAQRVRMDTVAANIANLNTTRNANGQPIPYRRRFAVFAEGAGTKSATGPKAGVHVKQIQQAQSPFQKRFQPGHPDADKDGMVLYPNIDLSIEFVN